MGTINYTSFTDVSALTRVQKEELLRRLRAASPATPPPIVARARKVAVIPDVEDLSDAQVDERLRQLLSGVDSPRYEQLRKELPQSSARTKRALLRRILELTFRNAGTARLSYAQQRSWFVQSLDPASPAQNIAAAVRAHGPLDVDLLERCINVVIQRHDALRTNFIVMGSEPVQLIFQTRNVRIVEHTFDHIPEAERMGTAMRAVLDEAYRPFDLASGSLIRLTSFRVLPQDRILLLNMHHIIGDEWSIGALIEELGTLYAEGAKPNSLEPLRIQYADYAEWEAEVLTPQAMRHHLSYWK